MGITEHQANMLRALADKKTLQFREKARVGTTGFAEEFANISNLNSALLFIDSDKYEVRIKPDVIVVNGIEVPAPEKVAPARETNYYVPSACSEDHYFVDKWLGAKDDYLRLERGQVHTTPDSAAAHGRALCAHKPG